MNANVQRNESRTEVVLFHSSLGLRDSIREWAERLRGAGFVVHTPDLYDGRTFDSIEEAMAHVDEMGGIETLIQRSYSAVEDLPAEVVYAGFSNGGGSAELLALTRPGARGAILMHAALPVETFGLDAWPSDLPLQIHYAEHDPYRDASAVESLATAARSSGARCEVFDYPGAGHLFADPRLDDFDPASAEAMYQRVLDCLGRVGSRQLARAE